mmetsp:Transcript_13633/g.26025  ORF Transcript_13633/g.26025 Transcript_13633/m.26025 type:complete len:205 (-) Transcript_13633:77-691(-)
MREMESYAFAMFMHHCFLGNTEEVKRVLAENQGEEESLVTDRDGFGQTTMHCAIRGDNLGIVKLLLERKANIEQVGEYDSNPLGYASRRSSLKCLKYLLEMNAQLEVKDANGSTALGWAANAEVLKALLDSKADATELFDSSTQELKNKRGKVYENYPSECLRVLRAWRTVLPRDLGSLDMIHGEVFRAMGIYDYDEDMSEDED